MTRVLRLDPRAPDPAVLADAAAVLRRGGLVAFPTETVYGLGANALDPLAVRRIFEAKGRPSFNPLIVHVLDAAQARQVTATWPEAAERLAARFWPGPLTLVLPRRDTVPDIVTAGLDRVAVRAPAHPVARALLEAAGLPIAAPSANRSTEISPTTALHVARGLSGRVDVILDGGPASVGIESTVLDLSTPVPMLLRPGLLTREDLEPVVGPIDDAPAVAEGEARPSPGMLLRHYAPRARVLLVPTGDAAALARAVLAARTEGRTAGALVLRGTPCDADHVVTLPDDPAAYARGLYAALHDLDALARTIVIEMPPAGEAWAGVRDRVGKAGADG